MSDISEASSALLAGYVPEQAVADARNTALRTLRAERQRGDGPPWVKDGKKILYSVEGFRAWLKSRERQPVRGGVSTGVVAESAPAVVAERRERAAGPKRIADPATA